jgi:hypothetical protein
MACSATLPQATLNYIHQSLHLDSPTVLYGMPSDRENISLFTAPIPKGQLESQDALLALVPDEAASWDPLSSDPDAWGPWQIPKTLVFIDDRFGCCTLTTALINKFPEHLRGSEAREVVCEYHSTMSAKALDRNLGALREGICRIMVCTEAVGMGLDVPDIERIIQWRVPQFLTLSSWWQRAGRAARNPEYSGVAIIYYEPNLQVEMDSPFRGSADNPDELEEVFTAIDAAKNVGDDADEERAAAIAMRTGGRKKRKENLPCEGQLLWYLNTRGCLRDVAMHYLASESQPRPEFNEAGIGAPCCCRCFLASGINPDLFDSIPVRTCTPFVGTTLGFDEIQTQSAVGPIDMELDAEEIPESQEPSQQKARRKSAARIRLAVRLSLEVWRLQILPKYQSTDRRLMPKLLLADTAISKLEAKCLDIKGRDDVIRAISGPNRDIVKHTLIAAHTEELAQLIMRVVEVSDAPEPPPRLRNAPYTAGPPKDLYSELDMQGIETKLALMMRCANKQLHNFDLSTANAKETARIKRNDAYDIRRLILGSQASNISDTESVAETVRSERTDRELMPPPSQPFKRGRG